MQRAGGELLLGLLHSAPARERGRVLRTRRSIALGDRDAERDDECGMFVGLLFEPACVSDDLRDVVAFTLTLSKLNRPLREFRSALHAAR